MMLCLRKGAKVCGKRTLYFFTDFILYFSPVLQFFRELFTFYATKLGLQIAEIAYLLQSQPCSFDRTKSSPAKPYGKGLRGCFYVFLIFYAFVTVTASSRSN